MSTTASNKRKFTPRKGVGQQAWDPHRAQALVRQGREEGRNAASELEVIGDPDLWRVLQQVKDPRRGWIKTTRAMEIPGEGCLIQSCTRKSEADGSAHFSEAMQFVPGVKPRWNGKRWELGTL